MYKRKQSRIMYLCAFGLPVLISILICICRGVYPFGRNCILHIDMYHQYEPFFTELIMLLLRPFPQSCPEPIAIMAFVCWYASVC